MPLVNTTRGFDTGDVRRVSLAILVLAALAAGLVVAATSGAVDRGRTPARDRAAARVAAAHSRAPAHASHRLARTPTINVPAEGSSACFIGADECSEQPCAELVGAAAGPTERCRAAPAPRAKVVGRPNPATTAAQRLLSRPGLSLRARLRLTAASLARSMVHSR